MSESKVMVKKKGCTNPEGMLKTALGRFSYMYPMLAEQLIADYGITEGTGLDIGCGPGLLSIELIKKSHLNMIAVDISREMCKIAEDMAKKQGFKNRLTVFNADVENLPFTDEKFDIIVSRGSFIFWEDKIQAFRELYRVLKPGGIAFIGGGDGWFWPKNTEDIIKKIRFNTITKLKMRLFPGEINFNFSKGFWRKVVREAGIQNYQFHKHSFWIEFKKP